MPTLSTCPVSYPCPIFYPCPISDPLPRILSLACHELLRTYFWKLSSIIIFLIFTEEDTEIYRGSVNWLLKVTEVAGARVELRTQAFWLQNSAASLLLKNVPVGTSLHFSVILGYICITVECILMISGLLYYPKYLNSVYYQIICSSDYMPAWASHNFFNLITKTKQLC